MAALQLFISAIVASFGAQAIKVVAELVKKKKIERKTWTKLGGMPSSHAALVAAVAASVFFEQGFSLLFVVTGVFAAIVLRDATGVRRHVGRVSAVVNEKHEAGLEESVGHTIPEVFWGCVFGALVAAAVYAF